VNPALIDTGVIVAVLDKRDLHHQRVTHALKKIRQPFATCEAVINESCYLLSHIAGAPEAVLANVEQGIFEIRFQLREAITTVQYLMQKYRDQPIDLADACLIQMADELNTGDILTLDSDFLHYRWRKTKHFNLLIPQA